MFQLPRLLRSALIVLTIGLYLYTVAGLWVTPTYTHGLLYTTSIVFLGAHAALELWALRRRWQRASERVEDGISIPAPDTMIYVLLIVGAVFALASALLACAASGAFAELTPWGVWSVTTALTCAWLHTLSITIFAVQTTLRGIHAPGADQLPAELHPAH